MNKLLDRVILTLSASSMYLCIFVASSLASGERCLSFCARVDIRRMDMIPSTAFRPDEIKICQIISKDIG